MACRIHPVPDMGGAALPMPPPPVPALRGVPRTMTRCECAEVGFQEIARQMDAGASFDEVSARTGCGTTCTACLPDLRRFLASR